MVHSKKFRFMVTIKINPIQHAKLKEYAKTNGLKLEFLTKIMVSKFLESLNEPNQQQTVDSVEIVEIKQPEMVQTIDVVKPKKKEGATKGLCLFANSPFVDFELFSEKINEQERFKRFFPIDIQKLYDTLYSWSESKFEKRKDWISTAFTFLANSNGTEFKPTTNGIPMNKRDQEFINWMNRD